MRIFRMTEQTGTPKNKEVQAIDDLLLSKEKREALIETVKRLAVDLELHNQRTQGFNDDVKYSAENFGISSALLKTFVVASCADKIGDLIEKNTAVVDVLTILKEAE